MKDAFEVEIAPDGTVQMMYQDGVEQFARDIGGEVATSCRASNVEWEESDGKKGWTVRSAYDRNLAVRYIETDGIREMVCNRVGELVFFKTRHQALEREVKFFWELLAPRREGKGNGD
jgi:hypothetical protein